MSAPRPPTVHAVGPVEQLIQTAALAVGGVPGLRRFPVIEHRQTPRAGVGGTGPLVLRPSDTAEPGESHTAAAFGRCSTPTPTPARLRSASKPGLSTALLSASSGATSFLVTRSIRASFRLTIPMFLPTCMSDGIWNVFPSR